MKKRISSWFAQCHRLIMTELGLEFRLLEMWFIFPILFFILVLKLNLILDLILLWMQFLGWISIHEISRSSLSLRTVSVQLSRIQLFVTPWTAALQASLSIINSRSLHKLMSIVSVISSNHLILCRPLLLPPSIFPSIRVFSNELVLHIRWPKYWSFSFSIITSKEVPRRSPSEWTGWISL